MASNVGVPTRLMREFINRKVTVDTSSGEIFKGVLEEVEENMNISLLSVKVVYPSGREGEMSSVYIKGAKIRLINLPDDAKDSVSRLNRPPSRGRGGFRGGRGGRGGGGRGGGGGGGKPSYDRRRY